MKWTEITIPCPADSHEAASHALMEAGSPAVILQAEPEHAVIGSLPEDERVEARLAGLRAALDRLPEWGLPPVARAIETRSVDEADWANAWKKHYRAQRVGRRIVVKPSWEHFDAAPSDVIIELDPGMAFGTGGHPTTRLCLCALENCVQPGMKVADVGTGTGILAIGAAKLGAAHVWATDIDALPMRIAAQNVTLNECDDRITLIPTSDFAGTVSECEIVVANIVANTIIQLAPELVSMMRVGGRLIVCGIVEEHLDLVSDALRAEGLIDITATFEDVWVCITAALPAGATRNEAARAKALETLPPLLMN